MNIVTLSEAKERLSIDFDTKDNEITIMTNSIESYLSSATGINFGEYTYVPTDSNNFLNKAKEYVLLNLYLDYYNLHDENNDKRLTRLMGQLKVEALYEP